MTLVYFNLSRSQCHSRVKAPQRKVRQGPWGADSTGNEVKFIYLFIFWSSAKLKVHKVRYKVSAPDTHPPWNRKPSPQLYLSETTVPCLWQLRFPSKNNSHHQGLWVQLVLHVDKTTLRQQFPIRFPRPLSTKTNTHHNEAPADSFFRTQLVIVQENFSNQNTSPWQRIK